MRPKIVLPGTNVPQIDITTALSKIEEISAYGKHDTKESRQYIGKLGARLKIACGPAAVLDVLEYLYGRITPECFSVLAKTWGVDRGSD